MSCKDMIFNIIHNLFVKKLKGDRIIEYFFFNFPIIYNLSKLFFRALV